MSTRVTRGSVAKSTAAVLATSKNEILPQQSSSLPVRLAVEKRGKAALPKKKTSTVKLETPPARKKALPAKKNVSTAKREFSAAVTPANTGRKRKRDAPPKVEDDPNELPHNLGRLPVPSGPVVSESGGVEPEEPTQKKRNTKASITMMVPVETEATITNTLEGAPAKKSRPRTANPYGLTPGVTPFPDWPHPTLAECHEVNELLSKLHGVQAAPTTIPKPSLTVSGCGEVPSILDAMIRTRLSAATAGSNSNLAIEGLVKRFGVLKEGIGKGSIDWNAVRCADVKDVFNAIKAGGLGETKSADIKAILEIVYNENQARCEALIKAEQVDADAAPKGAKNETPAEKNAEIVRAKEHVLSLDHLHALEDNDAMNALVKYPGIGVKTASCVMLFCMRRPSFAVDTHVFRLLKWLKWVPPEVKSEIAAFKHVEVKVPNELKYSLHQLFIKHGKTCGRCRAATGETSVDWDKGCVIDHLVTRTGSRKGGVDAKPGKMALVKPVDGKKSAKKKNRKLAVKRLVGREVAGKKSAGRKAAGKKPEKKKQADSDAEDEDDLSLLSDPPGEEEDDEFADKKTEDKKIIGKELAVTTRRGNRQTSNDMENDDDLSELSDLPDDEEDDHSELSDLPDEEENQ